MLLRMPSKQRGSFSDVPTERAGAAPLRSVSRQRWSMSTACLGSAHRLPTGGKPSVTWAGLRGLEPRTSSLSGILRDSSHLRQARLRCLWRCPGVTAITLSRPPLRARSGHVTAAFSLPRPPIPLGTWSCTYAPTPPVADASAWPLLLLPSWLFAAVVTGL